MGGITANTSTIKLECTEYVRYSWYKVCLRVWRLWVRLYHNELGFQALKPLPEQVSTEDSYEKIVVSLPWIRFGWSNLTYTLWLSGFRGSPCYGPRMRWSWEVTRSVEVMGLVPILNNQVSGRIIWSGNYEIIFVERVHKFSLQFCRYFFGATQIM